MVMVMIRPRENDQQPTKQQCLLEEGSSIISKVERRRRSRVFLLVLLAVSLVLFIPSSTKTTVHGFVLPPLVQKSSRSSLLPTSLSSSSVFDADKLEAARQRSSTSSTTTEQLHQQRLRSRVTSSSSASSNSDHSDYKFFDTARIHVSGGNGGDGCVAFRREKGEARGGPNGGRGGAGGSVWLQVNSGLNTLLPCAQRTHVFAESGRNGHGKNRNGPCGNDIIVQVPPGTIVRELTTQRVAGELQHNGDLLLVAKGGRGGRGNAAFQTARNTAPKLAERGEPGAARWLSLELRLVADVGFIGKPNAGKSTLLAAASAARPKIANYPFTTTVPNLGVCDLGDGAGLVLCDIPGLIKGASSGAGMGGAFLRHVQRCRVLLHLIDGTSDDPIGDYHAIQNELTKYDLFLAQKPQVVVLNKMDVPEVQQKSEELIEALRQASGHSRVLAISAATTERVKELMGRLKKFADAQPKQELPLSSLQPQTSQSSQTSLVSPEIIDLSKAGLDHDSDDYEIQSDPSYPGQWRVSGKYIEQIARMTHWEYPQAVERFGRQLEALGISTELARRGASDGDLIMINEYDFTFAPRMTNVYIPPELLEQDEKMDMKRRGVTAAEEEEEERPWRPFPEGGFLDVDVQELVGFNEEGDWDLLDQESEDMDFSDDEIWTA